MATMGFFSASLGETCTDCHSAESGGSWEKYADDNPRKNTARAHDRHDERHQQDLLRRKARDHVLLLPSRRGTPRRHSESGGSVRTAADRKSRIEFREPVGKTASADQILDKYIQAIGGADRLAKVTSFAAKGTYQGYQDEKYPVDVFAQAPESAHHRRAHRRRRQRHHVRRPRRLDRRAGHGAAGGVAGTHGNRSHRRQAGCGSAPFPRACHRLSRNGAPVLHRPSMGTMFKCCRPPATAATR